VRESLDEHSRKRSTAQLRGLRRFGGAVLAQFYSLKRHADGFEIGVGRMGQRCFEDISPS
jgi:hypothetical protein